MTTDPEKPTNAAPTTKVSSSKVVRSARAEALLGSAPDEQIASAVAEQKWARAADLIAHFGERILLDTGTRELSAWFDALPDGELAKSPRLAAIAAWVRIYEERYHDARLCLSQAERSLKQLELAELTTKRVDYDEDHVELVPHADLKQSLTALHLHLQAVSEGGRLPQNVADIMIPASTDHPLWRAGGLLILGRCHLLAGEFAAAKESLEAAHVLASTSRGKRATRTAAEATVLLGRVAESRGALADAERRYGEVATRTDEILSSHVATAEVGRASVALMRLDLDAARHSLARVKSFVDAAPEGSADPIRITFEGGLVEAWVHALVGDFDAARLCFLAIEKALASHQIRWPLDLLGAERAKLALLRRDDSAAKRWLQQHGLREGIAARRPTRPAEAIASLVTAHIYLTQHQPADAIPHITGVLAFAEATGSRGLATQGLVLLALAHFAAGQPSGREEARSALVAALEAAEPESMGLPFVIRGVDAVASELGLVHPILTRAARAMPPATSASKRQTPARVATTPGLIETAQVAVADETSAAHASGAPDVEDVEVAPSIEAPEPIVASLKPEVAAENTDL